MGFLKHEIGDNGPESKDGKYQEYACGNGIHEVTNEEPDLPPEYCRYRDEGCEYAASCLECPFPRCLYEEPHGKQRWLKKTRNQEINRLYSEGWTESEIATLFGVCLRTIQRAVKGVVEKKK